MCGYIKLHRQLEHWGWYQDSKVLHLFLHLLIKASTTNRIYKGNKLKQGQLITSYRLLAEQTGLSLQNVRTILDKLSSTQEIQVQNQQKFTLITVKKWQDFQTSPTDEQQINNTEITQEQHTTNTPLTHSQHSTNTKLTTVKEVKNEELINKKTSKKENFINSVELEYQKPLAEWLEHHKSNFKTEKQWLYQYKKLKSFANPAEVVEHSIGNNYKGLYAPKENQQQDTFAAMKEVDCYIEQSEFANTRPPSAYLQGE